ncbi:hypothetical protein CRE_22924 [Caenorhabditis remanei]|uniref:Uncharacterized protein n=1 Tax=Caenorhabditis remanei TaxID=31234 RepID=E3MW53_CAERE|nr:hypothetical protein CRE_22924 [Caenorhabditis remanei]
MEQVYNQEAINGILYFLHSKKFSPFDAHGELMDTIGEEVMSVEEIEEFYEKIERGEYNLKQKKEVTLERILKLPNFVPKYVNVETRLRLRKTSFGIRDFLDNETYNIDKLTYEYGSDYIKISGDEEFAVKYENIDGGILMRNNGNLQLIQEKSEDKKIGIVQSDLMAILRNEKLRIQILKLQKKLTSDNGNYEFGEDVLKHAFSQLLQQLKVRKLISGTDEIVLVMAKMDPSYLQSLRLTDVHTTNSFKETIYGLPQWKNLKIVHINNDLSSVRDIIENWTHFRVARLKFDCLRVILKNKFVHDGVIELIKKLRGSPNLRQYRIQLHRISVAEYNKILETLRTGIFTNKKSNLGNFEYPRSSGTVEMVVTRKSIWFEEQSVSGDWSEEEDEDYEVN